MSSSNRMAQWRQRQRADGLVPVEVWVTRGRVADVQAFAKDPTKPPPPVHIAPEPTPEPPPLTKFDRVVSIIRLKGDPPAFLKARMRGYRQDSLGNWLAIVQFEAHLGMVEAVGGIGGKASLWRPER